jgi:hypothetical protein
LQTLQQPTSPALHGQAVPVPAAVPLLSLQCVLYKRSVASLDNYTQQAFNACDHHTPH